MDDIANQTLIAGAPVGSRIGDTLRRLRLITAAQTDQIVEHSRRTGLRFGESAVDLGIVTRADLYRVLAEQFSAPAMALGGVIDPSLVVVTEPHSTSAEDYRTLRNALALRWFKHEEGAKTLAVISPNRGDGRSTLVANLAICFAQVGLKTLLIDADMREPIQHKLFDLDDHYGLSGYLAGRTSAAAFHTVPGLEALTVMPVGGIPPNPQELLLRPRLPELIRSVQEQYEVVIFDTPAADAGNEFQLVAAMATGALLVTRCDKTRTRSAMGLVTNCTDFGTRIVGSIMVDH